MPTHLPIKFTHVRLYGLSGIHLRSQSAIEILLDSGQELDAWVVTNPHELCYDAYVAQASSRLLIDAIVGHGMEGTFSERLSEQVENIRAEVEKRFSAFLVIRRNGSIPDWDCKAERRIEDYILRLEGSPSKLIKQESEKKFSSLVTSVFIGCADDVVFKNLTDEVALKRSDGIIILAKTLEGTGSITVSTEFTDEVKRQVEACWESIRQDDSMARVQKLLVGAVEARNDKLRAFMAATAAIEIFLNKTFPKFEKLFFETIQADVIPSGHTGYIDRINQVMHDKYRLVDKFSLVASILNPESSEQDIETFKRIKKARDQLAHGQSERESDLPIDEAVNLLKWYLRSYAASR
jgi:hypothetical protein